MRKRQATTGIALLGRPGVVALLLGAWCSSALASTGVDVECPETANKHPLVALDIALPDLATPPLTFSVADHGVDSSAAIQEQIVDQPLTTPAISGTEDDEEVPPVDETEAANTELAPAATRLPGVSESDQPRFRRQMYRTDI